MSLALFIARRSALSSRRADGSRASRSPAVGVAVAAVALSICVMLCSIAIVAGFKDHITGKLAGFNAHLQVYRIVDDSALQPDNLITLTPTLRGILDDEAYVTDYEIELTVPALLKTRHDFKGIYIKGLDGHAFRDFLGSQLVAGKMPDFSGPHDADQVAISDKMASDLDLRAGDTIPTFYLNEELRARKYKVAAVYSTHFELFDDLIALGHADELRQMSDIDKGQGINLRILTDDFSRADEYATRLQERLNQAYMRHEVNIPYRVESITTRSAAYFSWLSLLDTNVAVILTLMTIVACITLIAAMLILILDKVRLIGILRALGATRRSVRNVFVYMALRIAIYGILIGNAVGLILLHVQQRWHIIPLEADSYYIDYVPVKLELWPILILNAAVVAVVFLSLLIPSYVAGRISPAESMRYND